VSKCAETFKNCSVLNAVELFRFEEVGTWYINLHLQVKMVLRGYQTVGHQAVRVIRLLQTTYLIAPAIFIRAEDRKQRVLQLYTVRTVRHLSEVASLQKVHLHMPNF
jgi:hypothetical protein